jgi:hypothetical protein
MSRTTPLEALLHEVRERLVGRLQTDLHRASPSDVKQLQDRMYKLQAMTWACDELERELREMP